MCIARRGVFNTYFVVHVQTNLSICFCRVFVLYFFFWFPFNLRVHQADRHEAITYFRRFIYLSSSTSSVCIVCRIHWTKRDPPEICNVLSVWLHILRAWSGCCPSQCFRIEIVWLSYCCRICKIWPIHIRRMIECNRLVCVCVRALAYFGLDSK